MQRKERNIVTGKANRTHAPTDIHSQEIASAGFQESDKRKHKAQIQFKVQCKGKMILFLVCNETNKQTKHCTVHPSTGQRPGYKKLHYREIPRDKMYLTHT